MTSITAKHITSTTVPAQLHDMALTAIDSATSTSRHKLDDLCIHCANKNHCEGNKLRSSIPPQYSDLIFRPHSFKKGQHPIYAGDQLSTLYVVKSGLFKSYLTSEAGDEQVMGFHMTGDILGVDALADHHHSLSVMALENSMVCSVSINTVESTAHRYNPSWLINQVYKEVLRERHILQLTGRQYNTDARVAYFLLDLSMQNKARGYSEKEFKLTMPHRDIAHYLDMASETVSRVFSRLQDSGILLIERPYVTIIDMELLKNLADIPPPKPLISPSRTTERHSA